MAIKYAVTKFTEANIGNTLASNYGAHIVSLDISGESDFVENGTIVTVDKMTSLDLWSYKPATTISAYIVDKAVDGTWLVVIDEVADNKTAFIYQKPLINEETPKALTDLSNFANDPKDGAVRAYILHDLDRIYLSDEGFDGTPVKGATITQISNGKLKIS